MRFEHGLQYGFDSSRLESFGPGRLDRFPCPATAIDFSGFGSHTDPRRALITFDHLNRQTGCYFDELRHIVGRGTGSRAAKLYRLLGFKPLVDGGDAARFGQHADTGIRRRNAQPAEFSAIELRRLVTDRVLQHQRTDKVADGQTVGVGLVVDIIRGNEAAGPGHVLDYGVRIAGDMLANMPRDHSRVSIETSAGGEADYKANGLPFVEILCPRVRRRGEHNQADRA